MLLSEARKIGLVNKDLVNIDHDNFDETCSVLYNISKWEPSKINLSDTNNLTFLQEKFREKEIEIDTLNDDINNAIRYIGGVNDYSNANSQQVRRLHSIGLFEQLDFDVNRCPFCSGELGESAPPTVNKIKQAIIDLNENIDTVEQEKPKIQTHIKNMKTSCAKLREELREIKLQIEAEYKQEAIASQIRDLNSRRAHVVGRISLWLESVNQIDNLGGKKDTIARIESRLKEIDELLDRNAIEERKASLLRRISVDMTEWARKLELEHSDNPFSLDMNRVTVMVDMPERPVPLVQLGSGANWVGVHLLTSFALHKYFISTRRPVPRFIFMDQPSQVLFPSDRDGKSKDWEQAKKMYNFIFDRVNELNGNLQILIVDHAHFESEKFFTDSVIEDWRGKINLIPTDWFED